MKKIKWFQISVVLLFVFFCGIMVFAVVVAQRRTSGYMGVDAAKIQQMRFKATAKIKADDQER